MHFDSAGQPGIQQDLKVSARERETAPTGAVSTCRCIDPLEDVLLLISKIQNEGKPRSVRHSISPQHRLKLITHSFQTVIDKLNSPAGQE